MFNIGPMELLVLAVVGLIVLGPDRLPGLAKDAARMLKTLREMANGARTQLRDELGPEFADIDLRNLNPRTAIQRAVLGDTDLSSLNPRTFLSGALNDDKPTDSPGDSQAVSMAKPAQTVSPPAPVVVPDPVAPPVPAAASRRPSPRPRPVVPADTALVGTAPVGTASVGTASVGPASVGPAPFDSDAT